MGVPENISTAAVADRAVLGGIVINQLFNNPQCAHFEFATTRACGRKPFGDV
jgi:hypothetical protein